MRAILMPQGPLRTGAAATASRDDSTGWLLPLKENKKTDLLVWKGKTEENKHLGFFQCTFKGTVTPAPVITADWRLTVFNFPARYNLLTLLKCSHLMCRLFSPKDLEVSVISEVRMGFLFSPSAATVGSG